MRIFSASRKLIAIFFWILVLSPELTALEQGNVLRSNYQFARWPSELAPLLKGSFHDSHWHLRHWWKDSDEFQTWSWEVALETSWRFSGRNAFANQVQRTNPVSFSSLRLFDMETILGSDEKQPYHAYVDRLWYHWRHKELDLTIGRQPIGLGTSHFVSVLDILAPFSPGTLDSTYRLGVDAIRIQSAQGDTGEQDLIMAFSAEDSLHALIYRQRLLIGEYDFETVAGRAYGRNLVGFGFEGSIGRLGQWGEMAVFERKTNEVRRTGSDQFALSAVIGLEYFKGDGREWGISYLHQDFGASSGLERIQFWTEPVASQGWLTLSGRNYAHFRYLHPLKPLVKASLNAVFNLQDHSAFYQPRIDINMDDNINLAIFSWLKSGASSANPLANSEFGSIATGVGLYLQYYF